MRYSHFTRFFALLLLLVPATLAQDNKDKPKTPETEKNVAPTPQKPANPTPLRQKGSPLQFPEVDGWEKSELKKYPQPELGYSVNYDAEGGNRVSIYVYNGGRKDIRDSLGGAVKSEIERAKAEIYAVAEMGVYSDVKEEKSDTTKIGGASGKIDTLRKVLSYKSRGAAQHSEIYIFPFEAHFVKVRATRPKSLGKEAEEAVTKLLAEIETLFLKYLEMHDAARSAQP
ncbi:MAG: hypothetical protein ABIU09_05855 [Pyrinomonadaceae bacterium]